MNTAGQQLRQLRENLGLSLQDVETASSRIATRKNNDEFRVIVSRLSDIETKAVLPSIYRLYSLSAIYRRPLTELLSYFGIEDSAWFDDARLVEIKRTHMVPNPATLDSTALIPTKLSPSFDPKQTTLISRMIERWGTVPLSLLQDMTGGEYSYGYIGTEDYTMYPLLLPGSFVQIDEKRAEVKEGTWRSELERPIYMVETREGYFVSWCSVKGPAIILQPHPLSPVGVKVLRHSTEAEVLGQVVGVAMRFDGARKAEQELCD